MMPLNFLSLAYDNINFNISSLAKYILVGLDISNPKFLINDDTSNMKKLLIFEYIYLSLFSLSDVIYILHIISKNLY